MTDRELVELAAKAVRYDTLGSWDESWGCITDHEGFVFDPLDDDGDGARMESALKMNVIWTKYSVRVGGCKEYFSDHNGDRQEARRRASVRAAAEIGKAMQPQQPTHGD